MDYSRDRECDNLQGGVNKVYIFPFVKYLRSEITVTNNILVSFPYNIIYDMNATNINFTIDVKEDNDIVFDEKVSFQLRKLNEIDKFKQIVGQDYRVIAKDNNGKLRLLGLYNGMKGSYNENVGTNRSDFNGYSFNFENKESESAPYLTDLSIFNIMPIDGLLFNDGNGNLIVDGNNNNITN